MEQTEEWAVQRSRYMTLETLGPSAMIPSSACLPRRRTDQLGAPKTSWPALSYTTNWDVIDECGEGAFLLDDLESTASVVDHGFDLASIANNSFIGK